MLHNHSTNQTTVPDIPHLFKAAAESLTGPHQKLLRATFEKQVLFCVYGYFASVMGILGCQFDYTWN